MTKHTSRDEVWNHALRYALLEENFKVSHIKDEMTGGVSHRTIRDTLNTMVDHGWLAKDSPQAHEWHPGPKALNIEESEENFNKSSSSTNDADVYPEVDEVKERYLDRLSNSANLVVEDVGGSHALGSHGPLEEFVKIPYMDGDPLQVRLPRLRQSGRVLVCREQSIIRGDDGVQMVKQPKLRTDDIVPVHVPLLIQTDETRKEIEPDDIGEIPLPLFANVDTLQAPDGAILKSGWQYALKIDSISDGDAFGTVYDRAKWKSSSSSGSTSTRSSTSGSLDDIAESVGTVTKSANTTTIGHLASEWDDRKKRILSGVANTYD